MYLVQKLMKFRIKFLIMLNKITTLEFNKLTTENFAERSNQANLVTKTDLDKKLTSFNRKTTSNKVKCFELQKKLNSLITKNFFFSGRLLFESNDEPQRICVYQSKLHTLELKKSKVLIIFLVRNQMEDIILNLSHYILLSYIAFKTFFNSIKLTLKFHKDPLAAE